MLEQIRQNVRNPYIQAMLGLVILVFIFFFGWSMRSQQPNYVAKVNGDTIDYRSYQNAYNSLVKLYQDAYKQDLTPERIRQLGLGRRALDQLIDQVLLLQEADRRDLEVTDEQLAAAIQGVAVFQENGRFNKDRYLQILSANRLTPLEYEQSRKRELLLQAVEQAIRSKVELTEDEVEQEYRDRNTKADLDYVVFLPGTFEPDVAVTDGALAEYYDAEQERFRTQEKRSARYLLVGPEPFMADEPVTDQEVQDEYNWRASEFAVPEAVRARHLLLEVPEDATPEQEKAVRERIEKIREQILGGADFAELARKLSDDPGTRDKGGDLGFFERGRMVPAFEAAAFALEPGQVSEPVKTRFGYHLIQVEQHRPASQKSLDEVRDQLVRDIQRRKALEDAYSAADNLLMDLEDGKATWDDLAGEYEVKTTPLAPKDAPIEGVEKAGAFRDVLFSLSPDQPGQLLETPAGTYLLAVAEVKEAAVPPLDEVRDQVAARFRQAEARRLAGDRARAFAEKAVARGWDEAVSEAGLPVKRTGPFPRKGGAVPGIGWAPAIKEVVFGLEKGAPAPEPFEVSGAYYAVRLADKVEADLAGLDAEREKIRAELLPRKQAEAFQAYLKKLRDKADIEINEDLLL